MLNIMKSYAKAFSILKTYISERIPSAGHSAWHSESLSDETAQLYVTAALAEREGRRKTEQEEEASHNQPDHLSGDSPNDAMLTDGPAHLLLTLKMINKVTVGHGCLSKT